MTWRLRVGHEFEDLNQKVSEILKWSNFTAFFDGHVWETGTKPPTRGKTVTGSAVRADQPSVGSVV
jgi:hypothetical protein